MTRAARETVIAFAAAILGALIFYAIALVPPEAMAIFGCVLGVFLARLTRGPFP